MSISNSSPSTSSNSEAPTNPGPAGAQSNTSSTGRGQPSPQGLDRKLLLIAMCIVIGSVMSILDVTIVNVAINTLARDFASPLTTIQWVATGYTLALATVIPLSGWGADRFGTKRLYVTSIALFVLGSVLSGLAWNAESLIVFRVLQGFGGGMLMPVGMTILTRAAGPERLGRVMSLMGVPMLLGPIFGPILGGWLLDSFTWRSIFFVNIPVGLVALAASLRFLPADAPSSGQRLDLLGLVLLSPSLAAIIYGLAESSAKGTFRHVQVLVPITIGVVLFALWLRHTLRTKGALIDLKLFGNKSFAASTSTLMLMCIAGFGGMLLVPLYFQSVRGETALSTGLLLAPQGIGAMLAMPVSGVLTDRTGVGRLAPGGLALLALSFLGFTQMTATTTYVWLSVLLFVMGVGMGFTMMPLVSGALQTLRQASMARANTTVEIIQQLGAAIGTAVIVVLLTAAIGRRIPGAEGGVGAVATERDIAPQALADLQAKLAASFADAFWWAFGLVTTACLVALILLPKHKPDPVREDDASELSVSG